MELLIKTGILSLFTIGSFLLISYSLIYARKYLLKNRQIRLYLSKEKGANKRAAGQFSVSAAERIVSVSRLPVSVSILYAVSFLCFVLGFLLSFLVFSLWTIAIFFAFISALAPSMVVFRFYLARRREMGAKLIPAFQAFFGLYGAENRNIRLSLHKVIPFLPFQVREEFKYVNNLIHMGVPMERAMIEMGERVNNPWMDDFIDLLLTGEETGEDISVPLMKLINDMSRCRFNEEDERREVIAYRWGLWLMLLFAIISVYMNIRLDPKIIQYYTEDSFGQTVVIVSVLIYFVCAIGTLFIGRRRV